MLALKNFRIVNVSHNDVSGNKMNIEPWKLDVATKANACKIEYFLILWKRNTENIKTCLALKLTCTGHTELGQKESYKFFDIQK